jgi:hypothetical protein
MPKFLLLLLASAIGFCLPVHAQGPSPDHSWNHVEQLKPGTTLHIKTTHGKVSCAFGSADADSLTCGKGLTIHLQKSEILSISSPHRGRSAAVGAAIGGGAGAAVGGSLGTSGGIVGKGGLAAIFAIPLAVIGGLIGLTTDFTHGTIYKP